MQHNTGRQVTVIITNSEWNLIHTITIASHISNMLSIDSQATIYKLIEAGSPKMPDVYPSTEGVINLRE